MSDDHGPLDDRDDAVRGLDAPHEGKLLHLSDHGTAQPEHILHELRSYWDSLRNGRAIPARAEVEPRAIRRTLDYAFILERIAPGAARFRLAGRHLIDLMGMEVRGMPLCALFDTGSRGRLSDVLETVFRGPQIARIRLEAPASYGRPKLAGSLLLLPLRSDLGDVTRALGCLVSEGEIGQTPRRFDLAGEALFPVIPGAHIIEPSASITGFAESPASWRADTARPAPDPTTPEERRARFRLVTNDPGSPKTDKLM